MIDEVGRDNLKLQLDLYHCQIMEGDLARISGASRAVTRMCRSPASRSATSRTMAR